jgi:hypothetical protein
MTTMTTNLRRRRDLNEILRDTVALTVANWWRLLAISAVVAVPADLVLLGVGQSWIWSGFHSPSRAAQFYELGTTCLLIAPLIFGMTIALLLDVERGRASVPAAIQAGLDRFVPLLITATIAGAAIFAGFFTIIGWIFLAVRLAVTLTVVMIESTSGVPALRRSWELTAGMGWPILLVLALVAAYVSLAELVIAVAPVALGHATDLQVFLLAGSILSATVTFAPAAIATTLLYFDLADRGTAAAE